jgi:hypothetical protein
MAGTGEPAGAPRRAGDPDCANVASGRERGYTLWGGERQPTQVGAGFSVELPLENSLIATAADPEKTATLVRRLIEAEGIGVCGEPPLGVARRRRSGCIQTDSLDNGTAGRQPTSAKPRVLVLAEIRSVNQTTVLPRRQP